MAEVSGWEEDPKREAALEITPFLREEIPPAPPVSPLLIFGTQRIPPGTVRRRPLAEEAVSQLSLF